MEKVNALKRTKLRKADKTNSEKKDRMAPR